MATVDLCTPIGPLGEARRDHGESGEAYFYSDPAGSHEATLRTPFLRMRRKDNLHRFGIDFGHLAGTFFRP